MCFHSEEWSLPQGESQRVGQHYVWAVHTTYGAWLLQVSSDILNRRFLPAVKHSHSIKTISSQTCNITTEKFTVNKDIIYTNQCNDYTQGQEEWCRLQQLNVKLYWFFSLQFFYPATISFNNKSQFYKSECSLGVTTEYSTDPGSCGCCCAADLGF